MTQSFPYGRLIIEAAFGANLAGSSDAFPWMDITGDVLQSDNNRVHITVGRANEAGTSQPSTCVMALDNRAGLYSQGPQNVNYPNIKKGVPIRVRVDLGAGQVTRFFGYADTWAPQWDVSGRAATVLLSCSGALRRIIQGVDPLQSVFRRKLPTLSTMMAYWPCEDGTAATQLSAGMPGFQGANFIGLTLASNTVFQCSSPLPVLVAASSAMGVCPGYTNTNAVQVRMLASFPSGGMVNGSSILRVNTTGGVVRWELVYGTGGTLQLNAYGGDNTQVLATGAIAFAVDGTNARIGISMVQNGANVDTQIQYYKVGAAVGTFWNQTINNVSVQQCVSWQVNQYGIGIGLGFGHVTVENAQTSIFDVLTQLSAYSGEDASARLTRLCAEQSTPFTLLGGTLVYMGYQLPKAFIDLIRECEAVDAGVLVDGYNAGITYITRGQRQDAAAAMTINVAQNQLDDPFSPVDDDRYTVNKCTASRPAGASAVFQDSTGPLGNGVMGIGLYETTTTVNLQNDARLVDYASWSVHIGTAPGYRFPNLSLDFARNPSLAYSWINRLVSDRIDILNPANVRSLPVNTVSLVIEGYTETFSQFDWEVVINCSPFDVWKVITLAADTGDTGEFLGRYETDGCTTVQQQNAGSTSIAVNIPSGPLWTTTADDFPMYLNIGDYQIRCTAISGGSSPQTLTVDAIPKVIPGGSQVTLWRTPTTGLPLLDA